MRHRRHLELAIGQLQAFLAGPTAEPELLAEELRLAAAHLGRLTGRIDAEDVLGAIFGRFCIGK
jgi:tRNA modification GTPase